MSRPDDLDLAEARATAAREHLTQSTTALQAQLKPSALAGALRDQAQERQRTIVVGAAGVAAAGGLVAFVTRLLRRRKRRRPVAAEPIKHDTPHS